MNKTRDELQKMIQHQRLTQFEFDNEDIGSLSCIPLSIGAELLLLQEDEDFRFDGYRIVPWANIRSIVYDQRERFFEKLLKAQGELPLATPPPRISLQNWKSALGSLKNTGENIIVEWYDDGELVFFIGQITRLDQKSLSFCQFDSMGEWYESYPVPYESIIDIRFRNRYIEVFTREVGTSPPD